MRRRVIRPLALMALLGACLVASGCLGTIAEALLAPEALALQGASGGAQELGSALVGSGPLTDANYVAGDLNRILAEDDAAKERPELQALSDKIRNQNSDQRYTARRGSAADEPERRAERDRRVELPPDKLSLTSDSFQLGAIARHARRPVDGRATPYPEATPLDPWAPSLHVVDFSPVRVGR